MKFSVIIPVYNVEQFLQRCLESVLKQVDLSIYDFEVIIVNDGSEDDSLSIAQTYAGRFENIRIINQSNRGLSAARNAGLAMAKGEYVWFVDSDDFIYDRSLSIINNALVNHRPDVFLIRAANLIGADKNVRQVEFKETENSWTGKDILKQRIWLTCVPFYIFKRSFLLENGLYFYEGIFHEDNEFTPRMLYLAQDVRLLNDVLYFVYQNPNSITRTVNYKKSFDLIKVAISLSNFCNQYVAENDVRLIFHQFISLNINNALFGTKGMSMEMSAEFSMQMDRARHLFKHLLKSKTLKYIIEGFLFKLSKKYIRIYQFLSSVK